MGTWGPFLAQWEHGQCQRPHSVPMGLLSGPFCNERGSGGAACTPACPWPPGPAGPWDLSARWFGEPSVSSAPPSPVFLFSAVLLLVFLGGLVQFFPLFSPAISLLPSFCYFTFAVSCLVSLSGFSVALFLPLSLFFPLSLSPSLFPFLLPATFPSPALRLATPLPQRPCPPCSGRREGAPRRRAPLPSPPGGAPQHEARRSTRTGGRCHVPGGGARSAAGPPPAFEVRGGGEGRGGGRGREGRGGEGKGREPPGGEGGGTGRTRPSGPTAPVRLPAAGSSRRPEPAASPFSPLHPGMF